jgi:hypothetical protein
MFHYPQAQNLTTWARLMLAKGRHGMAKATSTLLAIIGSPARGDDGLAIFFRA